VNLATPFMQIKNKNLNILVERTKECSVRSIVDLIYKTEAFLWLDSKTFVSLTTFTFVHAFRLKVITASEKGDHS
jgi:hypothetical protein